MSTRGINSTYTLWIPLLIITIGSAIRLNVYFQNRSLVIDEANLARNIVERDYRELFYHLSYEQYSPPLFTSTVKLSTQFFGNNEYALRLLSILAGITSMILIYLMGVSLLRNPFSLWYVLLIFSFSILAVRYSSELKQYAMDAAICLAFALWAIRLKDHKMNLSTALLLSITGGIAVWTSMPVIFVLASLGIMLTYTEYQSGSKRYKYPIAIGLIWLTSFAIYYFSILKADANSVYLQGYHNRYFIDLLTTDPSNLQNSVDLLISLFRSLTDKTVVSIAGAIITFLIGVIILIRKNRYESGILLLPIMFCLVASHLKLYSLIERLTLFIIPFMLIVMAHGIEYLWNKKHVIRIIVLGWMILTVINKEGYKYFWEQMEYEDIKSAMAYLEKERDDLDLIYVNHHAVPAFIFYNELHDNAIELSNCYLATWDDSIEQVIAEQNDLNKSDSFWMLFTQNSPDQHPIDNSQPLKKIYTTKDSVRFQQAMVIQYQIQ